MARGVVVLVVITICFPLLPGFKTEAKAGSGAAFLGGMVTAHVVGGAIRRSRIRTAAAVEAASQSRSQTVYVQQPAPGPSAQSTRMTTEQKTAATG